MPDSPKRIEMIHYLRGIASVAVALFHLTNSWADSVSASASYGWLGVEVFFVISGFVIPYSIQVTYKRYSASSFASFILRRVVRIEVPYIFSIILVIVVSSLASHMPGYRGAVPNYTIAQIASNIFYMVPWTGQYWMQPVYWTLAYEFAFYLSIGVLFHVLFARERPIAFSVAVGMLIVAVATKYISSLVLLFAMGAAVFKYGAGREHRYFGTAIALACGITLAFRGGLAISLTGLATVAAIGFGRDLRVNGLIGKALTYLGTISYSLYLVHVPIGGRVVNLVGRVTHSQSGHLLVSVLAFAVVLAFAHVFYISIERPAQRAARQLVLTRVRKEAREFA